MSAAIIQKVAPPALPQARDDYDRPYQDQLNNVHRLFYNRLTQSYNALISPPLGEASPGGSNLYFPYAAVQRATDKTFTINTATEITFDDNDFLSGCSNDGTNGITVNQGGLYNYQYSVQWKNTDSQIHVAWIWLKSNNVNIVGTARQFSVTERHGGIDGHVVATANLMVQLAPENTVSMFAAVNNVALSMEAYPLQTSPFSMPSIPACIATLSFVSAI